MNFVIIDASLVKINFAKIMGGYSVIASGVSKKKTQDGSKCLASVSLIYRECELRIAANLFGTFEFSLS